MAALWGQPDLFGNNNFSEQDAFNLNNPYGSSNPTFSADSTGSFGSPGMPAVQEQVSNTNVGSQLPYDANSYAGPRDPAAVSQQTASAGTQGTPPPGYYDPRFNIGTNPTQQLATNLQNPNYYQNTVNTAAQNSGMDPQLAAIIAAISGTKGASGTIGGQQYGANSTAPGAAVSQAAQAQQAGANPWNNFAPFGGTDPWQRNVTAGTVDQSGAPSGQTNFSSANNPNVNYINQGAGESLAKMFGVNLVGQNMNGMGPAGAPSSPMYGLDFGAGDAQNAGQAAFWMARGDNPNDIMARLRAGISPPLGQGNRGGQGFNYDYQNPVSSNLGPGQVSSFVPGSQNGAAFNPTGYMAGASPSSHLGVQGGAAEQSRGPVGQGNSSFGLSQGNQPWNRTSNPWSEMGGFRPEWGPQGQVRPSNQYWGGQGGFGQGNANNSWSPNAWRDIMLRFQQGEGQNAFSGQGNMGGYANFANNAYNPVPQRRPNFSRGNQNYGNQQYYPGYEPNFQGGQGTYATQRRGATLPQGFRSQNRYNRAW